MEERRQHERRARPRLTVVIASGSFRVVNWSFGGFALKGQVDDLTPGALVRVEAIGLGKAKPKPVDIHARVTRVSADGRETGLACLHVDERAFHILQAAWDGATLVKAH